MANITELIRNYLRENRRLVIPGVGAFIVKESGEIIFSELLKEDDGRLHEILSREGLAEMEIAVTIDRFIFELQHETKTYGFYRMSGIGTLRLDPATKTLRLIEEPKSTPIVAEEPAVKPAETPKQESVKAPAVEAEPTAEPTTEEPTAEPTTEEPTAEPTIEEQTAEPTIEAPQPKTEPVQPKAEPKPIELPQPKVQPAPQKAEVRPEDTTHNAPAPKQRTQQRTRYKIDLIILACVVLVTLIALGVMGYGWYKSYHKAEPNDTEQMNALRDDSFRPHTDEAERQ